METIHRKRLLKLAAHLVKVPPNEFNFARQTQCALAHCEKMWPTLFQKSAGIRDFLGLDEDGFYHLFIGGQQEPKKFGGRLLLASASPKAVAANLRAFVKKQTAKKSAQP